MRFSDIQEEKQPLSSAFSEDRILPGKTFLPLLSNALCFGSCSFDDFFFGLDKGVIRRAWIGDTEEILAMLLEMDNSDYVQKIWPAWMRDTENVQLVALVDGRIAGCAGRRFHGSRRPSFRT
jgi:hypothetical protein